MPMHQEADEKIATGISYAAAAANIICGWGISEWSILIGILLAIGTFAINWYYKHQNMKIKLVMLKHNLKDTLSEGLDDE